MSSDSTSSKQTATPSARILERVREDATDLALLATDTSHDWKLLSDKNDTQLYEMTGESLSSKLSTVQTFGKGGGGTASEFYVVRAARTIRSDVNTVLDELRTSTSEDIRVVMKRLFNKQFESGAVVDSLSCTTTFSNVFSEDDTYSANWVTLRAFTKLGRLDSHRDVTMICYQDVFERTYISDKLQRVGRHTARNPHQSQPVTGSRLIGVHTFSSMNFKDIPELPKSSKTDRLHFRNSGVIVEELVSEDFEGPRVRVSLLLSLMPSKLVLKEVVQSPRMRVALAAGHEVAKKYRKWLQTLALGVSHLAAAKPALIMQQLGQMTWIERDHCFMCLKTFRTYRRRHHCRFCGEAVCGSCSGFVNMGSIDVNYGESEKYLDFMDTRGCNWCMSELQINLTMLKHTRRQQDPSLYNSSDSLSQMVNARIWSLGHSSPGHDSGFERDQVMPMSGGDFEHHTSKKVSFSTISSSYSGLSQDERAQAYDSTNSAEFMGKAPSTSSSSNPKPSSFSAPDASLSAFLASDPDILSLNDLTLSSESRLPLKTQRYQPQYQQNYDDSPVLAVKKVYHKPQSPSYSYKSYYSSGTTHSDLIQLNEAKAVETKKKMEFVVFENLRQTDEINHVNRAKDMIPLEF